MRQRTGGLLLRGQLIGLLDLREDLRLADDHAVETTGHKEQVAHRVLAGLDE